jgi:hypothetical protein
MIIKTHFLINEKKRCQNSVPLEEKILRFVTKCWMDFFGYIIMHIGIYSWC